MKVALIHALKSSLTPIETSFRHIAPEAELVHLMDTQLLSLLSQSNELTPEIMQRLVALIRLANEADVDVIQMTCSAFNHGRDDLQAFSHTKIFRSDEAVLDEALQYESIGLIATVEQTPPPLIDYMRSKKPTIDVKTVVNTDAMTALDKGDVKTHDELVKKMAEDVANDVEVVVLSQYSMAHVSEQLSLNVPIFNAPDSSARRCKTYVDSR